MTFKVIQGHWQWCHSIGHINFLLDFHCNRDSILHRIRAIITYFQKFQEVTWSQTHPFQGYLSVTHQYTSVSISTRHLKCQVSPSTQIKKSGHTHTHNRAIAVPGPLKWLLEISENLHTSHTHRRIVTFLLRLWSSLTYLLTYTHNRPTGLPGPLNKLLEISQNKSPYISGDGQRHGGDVVVSAWVRHRPRLRRREHGADRYGRKVTVLELSVR